MAKPLANISYSINIKTKTRHHARQIIFVAYDALIVDDFFGINR
jgi:hypothetical protein